jgi:hypothetical protein
VSERFSISIGAVLVDDEQCAQAKLQSDWGELNVVLTADDLEILEKVSEARWADRGSLKAGRCLGESAYWSCEDGNLSVLVGHDAETWEVGMFMPDTMIAELKQEIIRFRRR